MPSPALNCILRFIWGHWEVYYSTLSGCRVTFYVCTVVSLHSSISSLSLGTKKIQLRIQYQGKKS